MRPASAFTISPNTLLLKYFDTEQAVVRPFWGWKEGPILKAASDTVLHGDGASILPLPISGPSVLDIPKHFHRDEEFHSNNSVRPV